VSLKDRVRTKPGETPDLPVAPSPPPAIGDEGSSTGGPGKHCWVSLPVDATTARPGLLLEWRKGPRGRHEGLTVYRAQLRPGGWATVTEWVPAEFLTPAVEHPA